MVKKTQTTTTIQKTSALDRVQLAFEYDKPLTQIKQEIRVRTI